MRGIIDWKNPEDQKAVASIAFGVAVGVVVIMIVVGALRENALEREWIKSGICDKVTEHLYQPSPTYHQSCSGEGSSRSCYTYATQSDPYMRSLWRCKVPEVNDLGDTTGHQVKEFWRRTSEEFE